MGKLVHDIKIPFFTILFLFIFVFLYSKYGPPLQFMVNSIQTTKQNLFLVQGKATKTAVPDTAFISFGVTKIANTISDAQNQTNTAISKIIGGLQNIGIDAKNIQTTNYSVSPNYDYNSGNQTIKGYTVTQNMQITIKPIDKINQATDVATTNGANIVGSVNFGFDDATQTQLQNQVRQMAIDDAKQKAQSLANAAGMRLGKIVDIQEDNQSPIQPIGIQTFKIATAPSDSAPTTITPGENTLTENVTLSYETY